MGARASGLRRHNLSTLLERLHLAGSASRSELGTAIKLNRSTVADLVRQLVELGLVVEDGVSTPRGPGRPSPIVHVRPTHAVVIAVELAVDSVAVATVGLGNHVFDQTRAGLHRGHLTPEEAIQKVAGIARPLLTRLPDDHNLVGVGVAVASPTRRSDGFVHLAPNLQWRDVPVGAMVAEALGQPQEYVRVANEADMGALGEYRRGAGRSTDNMLFVSGEVGVGVGMIVGGRPMLGAAGYVGEAGHMMINPTGHRCLCGARGCWETEVGETALLRAAGVPLDQSRLVGVETLVGRLATGDAQTLAAVTQIAHWLGLGIGNLLNLVNPEVVILGGLYHRLFNYLEAPMLAAIHEQALQVVRDMVNILPSQLGASATLIGAAELCFSDFIARVGD